MPNIIEEIAQARHYFSYEGKECNTIIIPEKRRFEIESMPVDWTIPGNRATDGENMRVFGCEIIYSWNADKIKVGYTI